MVKQKTQVFARWSIAIATVKKFLAALELEIVFNVFKELDEKIYRELL